MGTIQILGLVIIAATFAALFYAISLLGRLKK
jgi:hypothetical protein